ncbi:MAG: hypothetical protein Q9220_005153 [cf. Caloplaca sp. 1 TL-2023]
MLTETFVASTKSLEKSIRATATKDLGIHLHVYQPIASPKSVLKKSSTLPNCLAVNATHIFAAQAEKSVVHIYNREGGNQEAIVPFQERITCLALAGNYHGAGILVLGTQGGRLIVWELATGRQISTSPSHLQPVTCLAVDPTFNFILSGSSDSNLHVWSLPSIISFSTDSQNGPSQLLYSPLRTLTDHRAAINAITFGHTAGRANFAISVSKDQTCIIWDFVNGTILQTYLLSANPLCLALDPADRAAYIGHEDGSVQILDFYKAKTSPTHPFHDPNQQSAPIQPSPSDRWQLSNEPLRSPTLCLQVSYDSTALLSGHENGKIHAWNTAKGSYNTQIDDLVLPVTNLLMLPPTGFPDPPTPNVKLHHVVKPRYESSLDVTNKSGSTIPIDYTFTAHFLSKLPPRGASVSDLDVALKHPSFPPALLEEGISELMTSDSVNESHGFDALRAQNKTLESQLRDAVAAVKQLEKERKRREEDDSVKSARKKRKRIQRMEMQERRRKIVMGEMEMNGAGEGEGAQESDGDVSSDSNGMSSG